MENKEEIEKLKEQLKKAEKFISSWAWLGSNGSPFTEKQAIRLQNSIQKDAWKTYIEIFGKTP